MTEAALFLNRPRASEVLARAGLDALLLTAPLNVHYASGKTLVTERFGPLRQSAALIPADPDRPVVLVASGFDVYFGGADAGLGPGVLPYLVSASHIGAGPIFPLLGEETLPPREQRRRRLLTADARLFAGREKALARALADLTLGQGRIGCDEPAGQALLAAVAPKAECRDASDLILHIRAIKTPSELALMRQAAVGTMAAMRDAAADARGNSLCGLRRSLFAGLCARGLTPVYGNIDGAVDETYDEALADGQAIMLDFVAHLGFYQSDIGRTLFLGEAPRPARRAAAAIETAWRELRPAIRPGISFNTLHESGVALLARIDPTLRSAFNPHLVGLQHWDQPRQTIDGGKLDLVLEAGMVLSLDCPLLGTGVGGSIHMEDQLLVTADGAAPLHDVGDYILQA